MAQGNKRRPTYAVREFTVPANGSVEVYRDADFITCLAASALFQISLDNAPRADFESGLTLRTVEGFHRVEIINPNGASMTVKLGFGKGDIRDSRLVISGVIEAKAVAPNTFTSGGPVSAADAAATLLCAENGNRVEAILSNDGAGKVYIGGDSGAGAGEGVPLDAGGTLVLTTTAAIYARNDTGSSVDVAVAEMEQS